MNLVVWTYVPDDHYILICTFTRVFSSLYFQIYDFFFSFSDPAISQMVHPHQKLVEYEEEASVLHQRLVMILQGWLLLSYASAFVYAKLAVLGADQC
jgi:hypothetical protein